MVVDIGDGTVDGAPVIVPLVHECDPSAKQSRVAASGKAYLRGYDGDFQLSHLEEQAFIAARRPPMFDGALVEGAVFSDLDPDWWAATCRVERLGRDPVTSSRNRQLVEIRQHVYSAATGARAVEALATGIPLVTEAVREAGLPPARYFDSGIRFTVMLRQQPPPAPPTATAVPVLSGRDQLI